MTVTVETLEKLERKITLTLPADVIKNEVESRLKRMSRQVKMDGFRPGKVPMNVVAQRYGYSVHYEVMNDKVGEAFAVAANEAKLRVAGQPRITEKEATGENIAFDAVFEVYPEVKIDRLRLGAGLCVRCRFGQQGCGLARRGRVFDIQRYRGRLGRRRGCPAPYSQPALPRGGARIALGPFAPAHVRAGFGACRPSRGGAFV